jgi:hypothetical protein
VPGSAQIKTSQINFVVLPDKLVNAASMFFVLFTVQVLRVHHCGEEPAISDSHLRLHIADTNGILQPAGGPELIAEQSRCEARVLDYLGMPLI